MVKILIIDDDTAVCSTLAHFFSNKNYQVLIANNGEEGLSIVKEQQPHIILLDILMPGQLGMSVLEQIKKIDNNAKVIMMTAVKDKGVMETAKKYGASDYIIKPFSLKALEEEIIPKILKELI